MKVKKIGIFSGTFDPIHVSHITIAKAAKAQLRLDEVWFLVNKTPTKKPTATIYRHRLAMVKLAIEKIPDLHIDPTEQMATADSYSYKSFMMMRRLMPDAVFTLIAGIDTISSFYEWENRDSLMGEVNFAIAPREGWDIDEVTSMLEKLGESSKSFKYKIIDVSPSSTSSSNARQNTDLQGVDETVRAYIMRNHLYT